MKNTIYNVPPKIITKTDYEYFRGRAQEGLLIDKAKEMHQIDGETVKDKLRRQSDIRKEKIREIDEKKVHKKASKLKELDDEAKAHSLHLLERADNLRIEQEEEILLCNKLILESKCRAIRDLQVAEKKLIESQLRNEDERINEIMKNREKLLMKEEQRESDKITAKQRTFARSLKNQILENDEQRILDFERKQEEAKLTNLDNIAWQEEEINKASRIKEKNEYLRNQIAMQNAALIRAKEIEREENRILDMRIQQFQKEKIERDKKIAEAQRLAEARKNAERMKIATRTMRSYNLQDQLDELNLARVKEEVEREWRNREKAEALRQLETRQKFLEAREEQINYRRSLQAMEIERDRREFDTILEIQKEYMNQDEKLRIKRQREAEQYRKLILQQVDEKAREKIEERRRKIEEGLAVNIQTQMRADKLKAAIKRKCDEMRQNKVPEIYIDNVQKLIDKIK